MAADRSQTRRFSLDYTSLPFFLSALAMNSFFQFSQGFRRYIRAVHVTAGILLLIVGVLILTEYLTILNAYAISLTPEWLFDRL